MWRSSVSLTALVALVAAVGVVRPAQSNPEQVGGGGLARASGCFFSNWSDLSATSPAPIVYVRVGARAPAHAHVSFFRSPTLERLGSPRAIQVSALSAPPQPLALVEVAA